MIRRVCIKCATCDTPIILRIAIMSNKHPCYTFQCPSCKIDIKFGLDIKKLPPIQDSNPDEIFKAIQSSINYKCIENCVLNEEINSIDNNENVINLMGDVPTLDDEKNDPLAFPMFSALRTFGMPYVLSHNDEKLVDNWNTLKAAWKLSLNGKETLSAQKRLNYSFFGIPDNDYELNSEIFDFSLYFISNEKFKLIENIFSKTPEIRKKNDTSYLEYIKFCHKRYNKLEEKIIPIIDTYIKNYETFSSYLTLQKNSKIIDTSKYKISSFDFDSLKKFYGDCFEVLADLYSVIGGLFNLLSNRDYDKFLHMDMETYLIKDKADKDKCFKDNDILKFLCEEFDAHIRNSSHHGGTRFDTNKNILILEFGRNKLKQEEMTIEEYIKHCILIFEEIIETNMILVFYNHGFELENK